MTGCESIEGYIAYIRHSLGCEYKQYLKTIQQDMYRERARIDKCIGRYKMDIDSNYHIQKRNEMLYSATPMRNQMVNKYSSGVDGNLRKLNTYMQDNSYMDLIAYIDIYYHNDDESYNYCTSVTTRTQKYLNSVAQIYTVALVRGVSFCWRVHNRVLDIEQYANITSVNSGTKFRNAKVTPVQNGLEFKQISNQKEFSRVDLHIPIGQGMNEAGVHRITQEILNELIPTCYSSYYGWVAQHTIMKKTITLM